MLRDRYNHHNLVAARSVVPLGETPSVAAAIASASNDQRHDRPRDASTAPVYVRHINPENMLRPTEDFAPILELAFRRGMSPRQSQYTLRSIERVFAAKSREVEQWTAAMRRTEAERLRLLQGKEEFELLEGLKRQLNTIRGRLDERSRAIDAESSFHTQMASLRSKLEVGHEIAAERARLADRPANDESLLSHSPVRGMGHVGLVDEGGAAINSTAAGRRHRLYSALHYSSFYDELATQPKCECCGEAHHTGAHDEMESRSVLRSPLAVHARYHTSQSTGSLPSLRTVPIDVVSSSVDGGVVPKPRVAVVGGSRIVRKGSANRHRPPVTIEL